MGVVAATTVACDIAPERAPDTTLVSLGAAALADSSALEGTRPDLAAIARRQADVFYGEAARLCGTDEQGTIIASCAPTRPDAEQVAQLAAGVSGSPEEILGQAARRIEESSAALEKDSVPLVARLYAENVVLSGSSPELPADVTVQDAGDVAAAKQALEFTYGVDYGLTVAEAYSELGLKQQIAAAVEQQHTTEASLVQLLETAPGMTTLDIPSPAAGYTFSEYPTPTDTGSALAAAEAAHTNAVLMWYAAAANADAPGWRRYALVSAGRAARDAGPFVDATGTRVWEASYLQYPTPDDPVDTSTAD
ncbi:hypothetical protein C1Y63_00705 [Corynebacterium sp. 13CS0277]|nr:hypothetical protein C1Y63_00705 [Corynebacterium sp. 13CS0277]